MYQRRPEPNNPKTWSFVPVGPWRKTEIDARLDAKLNAREIMEQTEAGKWYVRVYVEPCVYGENLFEQERERRKREQEKRAEQEFTDRLRKLDDTLSGRIPADNWGSL